MSKISQSLAMSFIRQNLQEITGFSGIIDEEMVAYSLFSVQDDHVAGMLELIQRFEQSRNVRIPTQQAARLLSVETKIKDVVSVMVQMM